jgi:hypothetical protein
MLQERVLVAARARSSFSYFGCAFLLSDRGSLANLVPRQPADLESPDRSSTPAAMAMRQRIGVVHSFLVP